MQGTAAKGQPRPDSSGSRTHPSYGPDLGFTRIVITHGTDKMTQTAQVLRGVEGKTVVLTGALAPARFNETDAPFNLGMAFAAAQIAPPGVYIAMNGTLFQGDRVVKDRAQQLFVSRN